MKAQRTRWTWLAAALLVASVAGSANAGGTGETVGRVSLNRPNVEIQFTGVEMGKTSLEVESVLLRLRDVKTTKVVRCASKYKGVLQLREYVEVGSKFVETGLSYQATPKSNVISFTVKPDATADYAYRIRSPDNARFPFMRCTVKDA